jgi:hypothetical protein
MKQMIAGFFAKTIGLTEDTIDLNKYSNQ